ncbi:MAG: signal peptidase II [Verrucomicrobiota bacterium]
MLRLFLIITLPLFVLDQVTKRAIVARFDPPDPVTRIVDYQTVIPGFFDLVRVHNRGVAFGMFNGGQWSNYIFGGISVVALTVILFLWKKGILASLMSRIAGALLISGILGNVTDRLTLGYVVDFLHFEVNNWAWPSFNVADACITIAAGLLILDSFLNPHPPASKESEA